MKKEPVFHVEHLNLFYGEKHALKDIGMDIEQNKITALIGPSGCGKSTFLRCLNRMNDLIEGCRIDGTIELNGVDAYGSERMLWICARRWGWCFKSRIRFRCQSMTISPTDRSVRESRSARHWMPLLSSP